MEKTINQHFKDVLDTWMVTELTQIENKTEDPSVLAAA